MNKEIEIPEGYEARIEGNKVIIKPIDSEKEEMENVFIKLLKESVFGNINGYKKEQKPEELSDKELQKHQDKLYNFKVFAARQAKEHHILFLHDFEWNNFCEGLFSYFNEKQKLINECNTHEPTLDEAKKWNEAYEKGYFLGYENGRNEHQPAEWSEEDEKLFAFLHACVCRCINDDRFDYAEREQISKRLIPFIERLKSLRPQPKQEWSEGEMKVLNSIIDDYEAAAKSFCGYEGKIMLLKAIRNGEYGLSKQEWSEKDEKHKQAIIDAIQIVMEECGDSESIGKYEEDINWFELFYNKLKNS